MQVFIVMVNIIESLDGNWFDIFIKILFMLNN